MLSNSLNNSLVNYSIIPWGVLSILLILFIIGLLFFKKRMPKHKSLQQKVLEQKIQTLKTAISVINPIIDSTNKAKKNSEKFNNKTIAGWDINIIFRQIRTIFIQINKSIINNDLENLKVFCEQSSYENILNSHINAKNNIINNSININLLENSKIDDTNMVSVKISGDYLKSQLEPEENNEKLDKNNKQIKHFSEVWNFILKPIAQDMITDFQLERWIFAGCDDFKKSKYYSHKSEKLDCN